LDWAPARLNRNLSDPFGSIGYAREELRAEIASMIVGSELGIGYDPGQHAAYSASWIKILEDQPLEIFRAAADGEKIHTYLKSLQQQQSIRSEELQANKSDIIKEYDRLVKSAEGRRELEKQNPGLLEARDSAVVEQKKGTAPERAGGPECSSKQFKVHLLARTKQQ
jgi:hypothetical protein